MQAHLPFRAGLFGKPISFFKSRPMLKSSAWVGFFGSAHSDDVKTFFFLVDI